MSRLACPSCGVPYVQHLGLIGTCHKLQTATEALRVLKTALTLQYHDARAFLDKHDVYHDDLNDEYVLIEVCKIALDA